MSDSYYPRHAHLANPGPLVRQPADTHPRDNLESDADVEIDRLRARLEASERYAQKTEEQGRAMQCELEASEKAREKFAEEHQHCAVALGLAAERYAASERGAAALREVFEKHSAVDANTRHGYTMVPTQKMLAALASDAGTGFVRVEEVHSRNRDDTPARHLNRSEVDGQVRRGSCSPLCKECDKLIRWGQRNPGQDFVPRAELEKVQAELKEVGEDYDKLLGAVRRSGSGEANIRALRKPDGGG